MRKFLLTVKYETGKAAWMAAELLGAHWDVEASLPILSEAAQDGTYAVGREAAVHGLNEALKRLQDVKSKKKVGDLLHKIAKNDKSRHVRLSALVILSENG